MIHLLQLSKTIGVTIIISWILHISSIPAYAQFEGGDGSKDDPWQVATFEQLLVVTLNQNYPNPFNPSTVIQFGLPDHSDVVLDVYNVIGQRVARLVNETTNAGWHEITFDASTLGSGIYIYRLQTDTHVESKRLILIK